MRISKDLAEVIAKKLLAKKLSEVDSLINKIKQIAIDSYTESIPIEVINFSSTRKEWLRRCYSLKLVGYGLDYYYVSSNHPLLFSGDASYIFHAPTKEIAEELVLLIQQKETLQSHYNKLFENTKAALLNLRTYKNIREQFPEAAEYLPQTDGVTTTALAVNLTDLRSNFQ